MAKHKDSSAVVMFVKNYSYMYLFIAPRESQIRAFACPTFFCINSASKKS
jgi:hypothetical protein